MNRYNVKETLSFPHPHARMGEKEEVSRLGTYTEKELTQLIESYCDSGYALAKGNTWEDGSKEYFLKSGPITIVLACDIES